MYICCKMMCVTPNLDLIAILHARAKYFGLGRGRVQQLFGRGGG